MSKPEPNADADVARLVSIAPADSGRDGVVVLTVSGELDMLSTDALTERLDEALQPPAEAVVLDLTDVRFLGSAALSALLKSAEEAKANGIRLILVASKHATLRPFEVTGISDSFTIRPTVDDALALLD
ncbi:MULTISPECIES: STAS domain-containing protein [Thermocrispum]|jgi:anti-anti-sigma factor|uniref:Anti-sigma factor antagonist n=1 Tax=Thermocrispum agreste TaxID=37925 RepID=A0ABD6FJL8_9PSEU|nr:MULTISPECIES: STAS domain-containing protein [Thermocrispum]